MFKTLTAYLLLMTALLLNPAAWADDGPPSKRPLFLFFFVHDDVKETDVGRLAKEYIEWFVKDLEGFTDRRVQLQFVRHTPGMTDFGYKGDDLNAILANFNKRVDHYMNKENLPRNGTTKYLLLTQAMINSSTLGIAGVKGYAGIASLEAYTAVAHELGHMLGGDHEDAKVLYRGGWWCETNMIGARNTLRANCYLYSDENRQRIVAHLNEYP
ncbi:hypothetical protein [Pseudomonas viridiflava]|uniref:hypothetical protein n=1 Tax=Pseudomonas viridiflava TaxID=33069 RepID=UPI0020BFF927|nr:hypothetical protein [Pseudomonas viridiflava]